MLIKSARGWELSENLVTPEAVFLDRRKVLAGMGFGALSLGLGGRLAHAETDPSAGLYPASPNPRFTDAGRPVTAQELNTTYNNFYEFGTSKRISDAAQNLRIRPWEISFEGEVEKPFKLAIDDLLKQVTLEERIYRHRCVEAWSMVVPWTGFSLARLVEIARPLSSAKYVRFETFLDPEMAPGQKPSLFSFGGNLPWPYVEGVTIEEAMSELPLMVTGAYGKPLARSQGAPIRLHLPWKYGFKSIKSIVKVSFTRERPVSFWTKILPDEYGFWANVNPDVPHPRWSQAEERVLGTDDEIPTRIFNGYGEFVADLYKDLGDERIYY